jgi:hypothetical protein
MVLVKKLASFYVCLVVGLKAPKNVDKERRHEE